MIKDILYNVKDAKYAMCITDNDNYDNHIPNKFIHKQYSPQILERAKNVKQKFYNTMIMFGLGSIQNIN